MQFSFDLGLITRCILQQNSIFVQITAFRCAHNIPVNNDSMKTTAARSTANGQPPFHSSLSYCGLDLSVSSKDVEIDFVHFGTDCDSILQPNTTCCQIAVFKCVKNNHTCEQWQHQPIKQQITTILLCITQIIITSEHRILEGSAAEAAACKSAAL